MPAVVFKCFTFLKMLEVIRKLIEFPRPVLCHLVKASNPVVTSLIAVPSRMATVHNGIKTSYI